MGEHLHVERINLADLFVRVTVSNSNVPTNVPFAKFNLGATVAFNVTNAVDSYYLKGGAIRLYRHDEPFLDDALGMAAVLEEVQQPGHTHREQAHQHGDQNHLGSGAVHIVLIACSPSQRWQARSVALKQMWLCHFA